MSSKNNDRDFQYDNPEPIKSDLVAVMDLARRLFRQHHIAIFVADNEAFFPEGHDKRMYYISNAERESMHKALQEYLTSHQNHG